MKLTEKQKRFADEYIKCGNATEAARLAGYSSKTANRIGTENLSKPVIKDYIANALEKLEADRVMDYTEAMQLLTEIARGEMTEKVVVTYGDNYDVIDKEPEISQRINALKEIVKRNAASGRDREALQNSLLQAQITKAIAEADIYKNKANKLIANEAEKAQINDLIEIGKNIIGKIEGEE
ncbi:terminase small subunit [Listeria monocytogenes]|uniref:Terminase small subunit n=1 Tax=Listeria monocytogenes TaxID=1639 RepID=A0AAD2M9L0_LISMN|nr:terminase small subunit [Listeria monocytogenes]EKE4545873.1 terminase small subunit [Listeria monocytogenes serotype 1/2a]EAA0055506.1 terminase small subunit [Listeria monocytogenes]EAA0076241.1 terminase small subunit [Listeria monocytogenes]EAC2202026.1 terminase small subunit [Listeria monocytogenes]EAC2264109.1 terminase small subunit [Listeria monocytogenes]